MRAVLVLAAALAATSPLAAQSDGSVARALNSITADDIRSRIGVIADDSMRGRDTPSPELEQTAEYIAGEFRRFGLAPGGDDGSFLQRYTLQQVQLDVAASSISIAGGPTLRFEADVVRRSGSTGPEGVSARVVAVSGAPSETHPMPAIDAQGAIVLFVLPLDDQGGFTASVGTMFQAITAAEPAVILLVAGQRTPAWDRRLAGQESPRLVTSWAQASGTVILGVLDSTMAPFLDARGFSLADARAQRDSGVQVTELGGLAMTVTVRTKVVDEISAPNTVGVIEGSDPSLKNEYIVFSAHMDHVGVRRPVEGDSIYNGADDDASGTIAIVELAEAFSMLSPRPKRSLIFVTVSGEEKGLWGSDYFAANPPVPIERIVANVNIDMIGRNWTDTVVVIGKKHSDLGETLDRVNSAHPELGMTAIDDIWPEENFYFRSDHYNFAKRGVPILFFFTGTHEDYHQPSDHVDKIDAEKESRIVKLIFYLGLDIADGAARPKWNPESYERIVEGG